MCLEFLLQCLLWILRGMFAFTYMQAGANANIIAGGATPLHIAADIGSIEIIKCLLKAGADPNVTDEVLVISALI